MKSFTTFNVLENITTILREQWVEAFGTRPSVDKKYDRTIIGNIGAQSAEQILVYADSEKSEPYDVGGAISNITYHNTVQISIDVYTNRSEERIEQVVAGIHEILKKNITILPQEGDKFSLRRIRMGNTQNLSDRSRKAFRMVVDATVETYLENDREF